MVNKKISILLYCFNQELSLLVPKEKFFGGNLRVIIFNAEYI
ncbi:hypothetical protein NC651_014011 [Populus alba x Populus x berolinensis]|nr:hypothetical protein NC651_014011 [Populus alba x Populus x berolinensis]